jgi:GNAT superfamily N-acetyltransferase
VTPPQERAPFGIRASVETDVPLVCSSWLKSHWQAVRHSIANTVFMSGHHRRIEDALKRGVVLVAHPEDDEGQILGWCAGEKAGDVGVVHYVYVKRPFRRMGIGRELARCMIHGRLFVRHTHDPRTNREKNYRTEVADACSLIVKLGSAFDPYLF